MSYVPKKWIAGEIITSDALNHIEQGIQDATQSGGGGSGGATFTPSVSSDGVISWTNDKGLPNPDPVDIMGPEGPKGPKGDTPVKGVDYWTDSDKAELVQDVLGQLPEISPYEIGSGLKLDESTNTLSVDTADSVEADNTRPITSAAVYTTVGNIEILLETI